MVINTVMSHQFKFKFIPGFRTFVSGKEGYTLHRGL